MMRLILSYSIFSAYTMEQWTFVWESFCQVFLHWHIIFPHFEIIVTFLLNILFPHFIHFPFLFHVERLFHLEQVVTWTVMIETTQWFKHFDAMFTKPICIETNEVLFQFNSMNFHEFLLCKSSQFGRLVSLVENTTRPYFRNFWICSYEDWISTNLHQTHILCTIL